jgi:paraquat-inducible protein B
MSQSSPDNADSESIPPPEIQRSRRFSIIWLIPIVAALIGVWLAVKSIRETGPTITISFKSAEGLVPGKTEIRYKDVTVGKVQRIRLSRDLSQVLVTADMNRDVAAHLTENTLFWIVRARVAVGEVSGINTLLTGAYIGMSPGTGDKLVYRFKGREKPPAVSRNTPGRKFILRADRLGSLDIGSPVYYRQVKVGRVTNVTMAKDGTGVFLDIFVDAPYDNQVKNNSRFYNASGLKVNISAEGVRIDTPSLASLLVGGVSFYTPENVKTSGPAAANRTFTLYENHDAANAATFSHREYYLLYFKETVRGLSPGAPVDLHGIKVGEVVSIRLVFDQDHLTFKIPVVIAIEPDRIEFAGKLKIPEKEVMEKLVEKGLRAQQRTANLLTGQSYVSLSIHPDAKPQTIRTNDVHPVLPTIPNAVEEITATIKQLLERFNKLKMEETLADIRQAARQVKATTGSTTLVNAIDNIDKSFAQFRKVTANLNTDTLPKFNGVLDQAHQSLVKGEEALAAANAVLGEGAPMVYNLNRMLGKLQDAARAVQALAEYLERHPDSILFGKGNQR